MGISTISTTSLADSSVTNSKLATSAVGEGKLEDSNVTTAKLADTSVTTAKLADASVTPAKGGTGQNFSTTAQGSTFYFSGTGTVAALAPGTSGQFLKTQGAGANPTWADASTGGLGQCRLVYTNATTLTLNAYKGNQITIAGTNYSIPSSGPTLGTGGLSASTLYYVYAYISGGTVTLEASTTVYSVSSTAGNIGMYIKSGDNSRTLVGMIRTNGSTQFADSSQYRFVRTWFNDPGIIASTYQSGTTSSTSFVEISSGRRTEFISWAGELGQASATGDVNNNQNVASQYKIGLAIDTTATSSSCCFEGPNHQGDYNTPRGWANLFLINASEGYHYVTLIFLTSAGTIQTGGHNAPNVMVLLQGYRS